MALTRREFLGRSALGAAALAGPDPLLRAMLGARDARAAGPVDPILVIVQLQGGNDGLNTVIPVDDGPSVAQRTLYAAARPTLAVPVPNLLATEIDADPVHGNRLALHPVMTGLKALYDAGRVAVVNGVCYPNPNLSHFESEDIWYAGDPARASTGWMGRFMDATVASDDLVAVDVDSTTSPLFFSLQSGVVAVYAVAQFALPGPVLSANASRLQRMYDAEADPLAASGVQLSIASAGKTLLRKMNDYAPVSTTWTSHLDGFPTLLSRSMKQIASILRYDAAGPAVPTGARFFHVRIGGFDTHAQQGTLAGTQPSLLQAVSEAIKGLYDDLVDLGVADRSVIMTFSEFGRRVAENGSSTTAGTDHGAAAPLFLVGGGVAGGIYGQVPALDDLDNGNLRPTIDFRRVYATVIDELLASPGAHEPLLPGSPWPTLPCFS